MWCCSNAWRNTISEVKVDCTQHQAMPPCCVQITVSNDAVTLRSVSDCAITVEALQLEFEQLLLSQSCWPGIARKILKLKPRLKVCDETMLCTSSTQLHSTMQSKNLSKVDKSCCSRPICKSSKLLQRNSGTIIAKFHNGNCTKTFLSSDEFQLFG